MNVTTDDLGRLVIPKSIRDSFGIRPYDILKIEQKNNSIVLTKVVYTVDLEKFIKDYILYHFGVQYRTLLIGKVNLDEIESLLNGYIIKLIGDIDEINK